MAALSKVYTKFFEVLSSFVRILSYILLLSLMIIVFAEVITRYLFGISHAFAEEWVRWIQIWTVYLMGPIIIRSAGHIKIDILFAKLNKKLQVISIIINNLLIMVYAALLIFGGYKVFQHFYTFGIKSSSEIRVPFWIPYSILMVGGLLFLLFAFENTIKTITSEKTVTNNPPPVAEDKRGEL